MKNLVIISSIIDISNKPLNYTNVRSVYTYDERLEQTIKTIDELNRMSNKDVLLVETSNVKESDEELIKSKVDIYLNLKDNANVRNIVDGGYKGSGEAIQVLTSINSLDINQYDNIIKISGRYWLNEKFNEGVFDNDYTMFKESHTKTSLSTVIYKINKKDYPTYIQTLKKIISSNQMMEVAFLRNFNGKYVPINNLGIMGHVSVNGVLWEI